MTIHHKLVNWLLASQFAAILVICSKITIPLGPIPLTGQTLAVGLIASLLTPMAGTLAILLYLLLGLIGLPVFASSATSLAALFGPTGGFIWGFLVYVGVTSWWLQRSRRSPTMLVIANVAGAIMQLVAGSLWITVSNQLSLVQALTVGILPFITPALIKLIFVVIITDLIVQRTPLPLGQQPNL
ncbi:biotin transporter BioY [Secundilactobacillus folii]|uniref:Biotin transporter n=1 Tax=Secundilactobacillus folii TaxID=2678357 RepID=A0A7X2XWM2_9LACO|nr:biotin transporter BioY [Secundilactobacillus folii]MTV83029.1 biotin transporter BioY [Secundilactobacillus folii]